MSAFEGTFNASARTLREIETDPNAGTDNQADGYKGDPAPKDIDLGVDINTGTDNQADGYKGDPDDAAKPAPSAARKPSGGKITL